VAAFFIPGVSGDLRVIEDAYVAMRRQIELDMGRSPSSRRIMSVWARRGSVDCVTEVGCQDPLLGGTVMAIFDMGRHQPFIVWCQQDAGVDEDAREAIGPEAYSVMEFDG
jgi:hypothetical protein